MCWINWESARFLIQIRQHIAYPLFTIFRKSLDEGLVPDDWKSANISPIFKKGNRNMADNYRPVSLTSQISKIFETIIREENNLERRTIYWAIHNMDSEKDGHALLIFCHLDKVSGCLDSGEPVDTIFWISLRHLIRFRTADWYWS